MLYAVDHGAHGSRLVALDPETGEGTGLCSLPLGDYPTLAFAGDGSLLIEEAAHDRLLHIDPCTCESHWLAGVNTHGAVGLTVVENALLAIDGREDTLVQLVEGDPTVLGDLEFDATVGDLTQVGEHLLFLDVENDELASLSLHTAETEAVTFVDADLDSGGRTAGGLEYMAQTDRLYACIGEELAIIDKDSGAVRHIGPVGLEGACTALAASPVRLACE